MSTDEQPDPTLAGLICAVCGGEPAVGVASSALGPISQAYGRRCLEEGAESLWLIHSTLDCIGGPSHAAEHVKDLRSFKDGAYIDWPAILACYVPQSIDAAHGLAEYEGDARMIDDTPVDPRAAALAAIRAGEAYSERSEHIYCRDSDNTWWFADETDGFTGPYRSQRAAERALAIYCWWYLGSPLRLRWPERVIVWLVYAWRDLVDKIWR